MTDTSQVRLAYIEESSYGVIPATPAWKKARYTSESLQRQFQFVTSNEIRSDRNVSDAVRVGAEAGGDIGVEMSYGSFDDWIAGLMFSNWSSDTIENGVTPKSFAFEKTLEMGATDHYQRFVGCRINTFNLNMRSREIVTASFGMMAKGGSHASAIVSGATYVEPNANPVIEASTRVSGLTVTGASGIKVMEMTLNVTNNLRQQPVIGSIDSKGIGAGRFEVSGSLNAYFDDAALYDLFANDTYTDLAFRLGGASALGYDFLIPNLKFTQGSIVTPGNDQDVMLPLNFTGLFDATEGATLLITRDPS